jgi:VWFA-related protein
MGKKWIAIGILVIALLVLPNPGKLNSGEAQITQESSYQYRVIVVLKLVQVFVTDNKGNPVTDLTKDDFILYDNGKLQPITDFETHMIQRPVRPEEPEKKVEEEIAETALPPGQDTASRMNRKFFFIFASGRLSLLQSKKAAHHFIDTQIQPTDEVGVISYNIVSGFTIHEYLTSDMEKVRKAIDGVEESGEGISGAGGPTLEGARARAESEVRSARGEGEEAQNRHGLAGPPRGGINISSYFVTSVDPETLSRISKSHIWVNSFTDLARALRYIPGYKNIMLFSGGIPRAFVLGAHQTLREKYEEMGKEFAASNSPVHTVSTAGPRRVQTLEMLSELSGGEYFHNINYYDKIANQIQDVTSNYYVLGYYIDEKWDGEYHSIEVKVKRKGCEVHAQQGYYNPKPFTELDDFDRQLRLVDLALSDKPIFQEPLPLSAIALPCPETQETNLMLLSEISREGMEEVLGKKTELTTFVINSENNVLSSIKADLDFSSIRQKRIFPYVSASLDPGPYECRVIIRNMETGRAAKASISVDIPEPAESGITLYPPLLIIPEKKSYYLNLIKVEEEEGAKKKKKEKEEEESLSLADIYPFLSNEHSPLVGDLEQDTPKLLAVVHSAVKDIPNPDIELTAFLFDYEMTEKTPLPFSIIASEKQEETDVLLCEFQMPEMKPGEYFIKITAEERKTRMKAEASQSFSVK